MSKKHRILIQTNPCFLKTGLAENARTLLKYLWKTGKYEIAHYCTQVSESEHQLQSTPWKSYGALPNDPRARHELNQDPSRARDAAYGSWNIDNVIKDFKPTIWLGSDDIWGFPHHAYGDKPWFKKINSIYHITIDSVPILEQAYEQAEKTKHYLTWAKFASDEMHKKDEKFSHVSQIYGAMDITKFSPISDEEKNKIRAQFGISPDTVIFLFVGRNQLRKQFVQVIEAFSLFKKENPTLDAKLFFHTSFAEKGAGWDIPKMAKYYGLKDDDILCTYVCRSCGQWIVAPYSGEDKSCPYCKSENGLVTANIVHGVPDDQMKYVYGISDACISAFSSGGQEYHSVQSLLCGKPLACTNYSCGKDFCEQDFVFTLEYTTYVEHGTNFLKSTTSIKDLKKFFFKTYSMSKKERFELGEKGRKWATKTFSIETIGAKWEMLFDSLPIIEWDDSLMNVEPKNENFAFPNIENEDDFIKCLYKEILKMDENDKSDGFKNWKQRLKEGISRQDIYNYFIGVAKQENSKNNTSKSFDDLISKNRSNKRALFLIKESIGDIAISTSLFKSFKNDYPDVDIYVMAEQKYHDLLFGNDDIYKILPYIPAFEQEMIAIGAGQDSGYFDYYYHIAIQTQRVLSYLSQPKPSFKLD